MLTRFRGQFCYQNHSQFKVPSRFVSTLAPEVLKLWTLSMNGSCSASDRKESGRWWKLPNASPALSYPNVRASTTNAAWTWSRTFLILTVDISMSCHLEGLTGASAHQQRLQHHWTHHRHFKYTQYFVHNVRILIISEQSNTALFILALYILFAAVVIHLRISFLFTLYILSI